MATIDMRTPERPGLRLHRVQAPWLTRLVPRDFPVLFQGGVRYRWDGEETYGMLERSSMRDRIDWG